MTDETQETDVFTRRTVLKTGTGTVGALAISGVAVSSVSANGERRGGHALAKEETKELETDRPFWLMSHDTYRELRCQSDSTAKRRQQYHANYCVGGEPGDPPADFSLWVHPDDPPIARGEDDLYEINTIKPCDNSDYWRISFEPAEEC